MRVKVSCEVDLFPDFEMEVSSYAHMHMTVSNFLITEYRLFVLPVAKVLVDNICLMILVLPEHATSAVALVVSVTAVDAEEKNGRLESRNLTH